MFICLDVNNKYFLDGIWLLGKNKKKGGGGGGGEGIIEWI
jgi:hypothetical protein